MEQQVNNQQPVLFEVISPINYEDSLAFQKFSLYLRNTFIKVFSWIIRAILLLQGLLCLYSHDYFSGIGSILLAVFYNMFILCLVKINTRKNMKSPILNNNINKYYFYQDCYVNVDNQSTTTIFYNQLYDAHETDKYFYLFIERNKAHIIPKSSFTYNTPDEMRKLLSMKLGPKFIVHCK